MSKQFQKWIGKKEELHNRKFSPNFNERDVYWGGLGENIGDEENGKSDLFSRPILIVRKFNKNLFILFIPSRIFFFDVAKHILTYPAPYIPKYEPGQVATYSSSNSLLENSISDKPVLFIFIIK